MKMLKLFWSIVLMVALGCVATEDYNFRDANRPEYSKSIAVADLQRMSDEQELTLHDVRLLEDFNEDQTLIPGATYKNPDDIALWSAELPVDSTIVVYCVRGKWVSQKAAQYLAEEGYDVVTLDGGIEAWKRITAE